MGTTLRDLLFAIRRIGKSPGPAALIVAILALSIGAATTIFSLAYAVLFEPLPFPEPGRLVEVFDTHEGERWSVSPLDFRDLRRDNRLFVEMGAYTSTLATLTGEGEAERLPAAVVTAGFLNVLGVAPALGRAIREPEELAPAHRKVILSDGLWRRRFGADPAVIGRSITLGGEGHEVIGVMPPGFDFPHGSELWAPIGWTEDDLTASQRGAHYLRVIGRLRPGVTVEEAAAEVAALDRALVDAYPGIRTGWGTGVVGLRDWITGDVRPALLILLGAVAVLLLIAWVNVAHLLVVQALARRRDRAIQRALGASGLQLLRQRLAYGLLLSGLGGCLGVLVALWFVELVRLLPADQIPRLEGVAVGPPALALAAGVTLLCGVLIGLLGGDRVGRGGRLTERLGGGRGVLDTRGTHRLRALLVVAETALAVVLLAGAGLLVRSMLRLQDVDPGFESERTVAFDLSLPDARYPEPAQARQLVADLIEQLDSLPGVRSAGAMSLLPLSDRRYSISVSTVDGAGPASPGDEQQVEVRVTTPGTLDLLGVPRIAGRALASADGPQAPPVALVNQTAARLLWPGQSPLGHRVALGTTFGLGGPRAGGEVVGVVGDFRDQALDEPARPTVFLSHAQFPISYLTVVMKTSGEPLAMAGPGRERLAQLDPDLPLSNLRTVESAVDAALRRPRFNALLVGLFALAALGLTALGLYGTIAFGVARRTREIGLRMAVGADRGSVLWLVLRGAAGLALAGVAAGLALALLFGRALGGLLFEIRPADPATLLGVGFLTTAIALAASLLPAQRATRLDPTTALRTE